jgi:hypothetical protein
LTYGNQNQPKDVVIMQGENGKQNQSDTKMIQLSRGASKDVKYELVSRFGKINASKR